MNLKKITNLILDNNLNNKEIENKKSNNKINLINVSEINKLSSYKKLNEQKPKISSTNKTHYRNHSSNFTNNHINNKRYSLSQDKTKQFQNNNEIFNKTIKKDSLIKNKRNNSSVIKTEHNIKLVNKKLIKEKIKKKIISTSFISMTGYSGENKPEKINQDNFFITSFPDFGFYFIGVCDGHGQNGHFVSNFLKENIPKNFKNEIIKKYKYKNS